MTVDGDVEALVSAVEGLRDAVEGARLPLDVTSRAPAEASRRELLQQLDDYVLPAAARARCPGARGGRRLHRRGQVDPGQLRRRAEVSPAGVLRPTTTGRPCSCTTPTTRHWFADERILPGLARVTGQETARRRPGPSGWSPSTALPAGLALLDAPDIDSVVAANRALAAQLLAAADLWLFVTTAARYADAVPWDLLRTAADRGTAVAMVLDRVPPDAVDEMRRTSPGCCVRKGCGRPRSGRPGGQLAQRAAAGGGRRRGSAAGCTALASATRGRSNVVGRTLGGIVDSSGRGSPAGVGAGDQQDAARVLAPGGRRVVRGGTPARRHTG